MFPYLNDCLIKSANRQLCPTNTQTTIDLLHDLGFTINAVKSHLQPLQVQPLLGAVLNMVTGKAHPKQARFQAFQLLLPLFQPHHHLIVRNVMCLLGMIASCIARLHMLPLQECLAAQRSQAEGHWEDLVLVWASSHCSLQWWNNNNLLQGRTFLDPFPQATITMNSSSLMGCRAHLQDMTVQGMWVPHPKGFHINQQELLAIQIILKFFFR